MTDTKSNDSEYGPWINHDGKGCPCIGQWVIIQFGSFGINEPRIAGDGCKKYRISPNDYRSAWVWLDPTPAGYEVIRYRLRKPKGMQILEALLENLPDAVKELSKETVK